MKKRLITSALPYVNNVPHLGNLTQVLSADVFARFCRLRGYETMYVCGNDEYGTTTETRAAQEGVSPKELCDKYHAIHAEIYRWFNIDFNKFGRTATPKQTEIVQRIFLEADRNGYITERETQQLYCPSCRRFLADRYVEGTCPRCGSSDARGDQCDSCGSLLDPTELLEPRCSTCGSTPELRRTRHLYIDLPKTLPMLEKYIDEASERGFWAKNAVQMTRSWIRDGLIERCITRDLKWGIPVPKPGYEDKVFYVWFDAPIGYISITANLVDDWERWWKSPEDTELFQFIGKDNIPFHTVIFPASLLASGEKWTMLHHMSSTEYLNYEGGKFSKSRGIGIFGNDAQSTGIPADVWRFYMFYNRPERGDVTFTWREFQSFVNGELVGNLSNLVNRVLTFVKRYFGGVLPHGDVDEAFISQVRTCEEKITDLLEHASERDAFRAMFELSGMGNKYFQENEPWRLVKENAEAASFVLRTLLVLIKDLGILVSPFMPETGARILGYLGLDGLFWNYSASPGLCDEKDLEKEGSFNWASLGKTDLQAKIGEIDYLFSKLDDSLIDALRERFSGSQAERAKSVEAAADGTKRDSGETSGKENSKEKIKKEKNMQNNNNVVDPDLPLPDRFAARVILKVAKITNVEKHPNGDILYILTLDTGEAEPRTIVSSIVPYYTAQELQGRNIVLVSNLKPANFRGVKSRGMLLAVQDPAAPEHSTCEVLFADDIPAGTVLVPEGRAAAPADIPYVKPDHFFDMPLFCKDGVLCIEGVPFVPEGEKSDGMEKPKVCSKKYLNGPVG